MRVATATCVHFFSMRLMLCNLNTLYNCKSLPVSLTCVFCFIHSLYYGFILRNGLDQPLTPNFKTCLTSTCIVTKTRYCFSVTSSLDMDQLSLQFVCHFYEIRGHVIQQCNTSSAKYNFHQDMTCCSLTGKLQFMAY